MSTDREATPIPKWMAWAGWIISLLPAAMLLFSATGKLMNMAGLDEGFKHIGWPRDVALGLGIVELVSTVLYLIPQTAVLGAILVTGYLGGAIATHVRIGEGFIIQALLGGLVWLGLYLRDPRVRALIPLRAKAI
jgi:DoxX-like family